jgi:hypothetical protein
MLCSSKYNSATDFWEFLTFGNFWQLKKDYALLFMAASFLGGLIGNTLMNVGPPSTMNPNP